MRRVEVTYAETSRRRFRPWANIIRIFRRKSSVSDLESPERGQRSRSSVKRSSGLQNSLQLDCIRSQSTEMIASLPKSIPGTSGSSVERDKEALSSELNESRDSVFEVVEDQLGTSISGDNALPGSSLSSSTLLHHLAELRAAVRRRRSTDEDEDLGLPHSPATASLSATEILSSGRGNNTHSTGSDASLLSMDSCETEEETTTEVLQQETRKPAEKSLSETNDGDWPLSHSAARHKISVRPKKTHALPRQRRLQQLAVAAGSLPFTPEVNEDLVTSAGGLNAALPEELPKKEVEDPALKSRSLSLTRAAASAPEATTNSSVSSTKLARSKSSVDRKIQYEVVNFWRRTREKQVTSGDTPPDKKNRKHKREKNHEVLDSSYDSSDSLPPQPFLSRIFGSKRSSIRRNKDQRKAHPQPEAKPSGVIIQQNKGFETIEVVAETIDPESKTVPPRFSGPQHQMRMTGGSGLKDSDEKVKLKEASPQLARPRIHMSPYQRRVARVGNDVEDLEEPPRLESLDASLKADGIAEPEGNHPHPPESPQSSSSLDISDAEVTPLSSASSSKENLAEDVFVSLPHSPADAKPVPKPRSADILADRKDAQTPSRQVPEFLQIQLHPVSRKVSSNVVFNTDIRPEAKKTLNRQRAKSFQPGDKAQPEEKPHPRIRNPDLGRSYSIPPEKPDSRPVIIHVKNGIPVAEVSGAPEECGLRCKQGKDDAEKDTLIRTPPSSESDVKLRRRPGPEATPSASAIDTCELMKVFARRSLKLSSELSDSGLLLPSDPLNPEPEAEKVTSATEDYENSKNMWKRMAAHKKVIIRNPPLATDEQSKSIDEVPKSLPPRQSKVLDLVHNFQRLQVT